MSVCRIEYSYAFVLLQLNCPFCGDWHHLFSNIIHINSLALKQHGYPGTTEISLKHMGKIDKNKAQQITENCIHISKDAMYQLQCQDCFIVQKYNIFVKFSRILSISIMYSMPRQHFQNGQWEISKTSIWNKSLHQWHCCLYPSLLYSFVLRTEWPPFHRQHFQMHFHE